MRRDYSLVIISIVCWKCLKFLPQVSSGYQNTSAGKLNNFTFELIRTNVVYGCVWISVFVNWRVIWVIIMDLKPDEDCGLRQGESAACSYSINGLFNTMTDTNSPLASPNFLSASAMVGAYSSSKLCKSIDSCQSPTMTWLRWLAVLKPYYISEVFGNVAVNKYEL